MSSNRNIDAMVARHCFQWEWRFYPELNESWLTDPATPRRHGCVVEATPSAKQDTGSVPAFSTDPACAWNVVDKIQKDSPTWRFSLRSDEVGGLRWLACFITINNSRESFGRIEGEAIVASRELAICLAALRAVGCPESEIETALSERRRA